MDAPTDRDLALRVRRGDVEAFGPLVNRYQDSVYSVCYRVLRDTQDAEDLTQEAFIRAYEKLDLYDIDQPFGPWIRRIAANLAINALKKRKLLLPIDEQRDRDPHPARSNPETALERAQLSRDVQAALGELLPHYRVAIELRHFHDLSYAEIAETMEIPLNTARSYLHRARQTLDWILKER
jgi:RNA polymerase sigma-70 factor (ECF subfamily)